MKQLELRNIGFETIHQDAFAGVNRLEFLVLVWNKITTPSYFIIPPSTNLHTLELNGYQSKSTHLEKLGIIKQRHLSVIKWYANDIHNVTGMFCSDEHNSKLRIVSMESNAISQLLPPLFDNCGSLKYLSLFNNTLSYLDAVLFANNVSLVGLDLSHNMLRDNVSWSGLLAQQHELRYLNISLSILVSWTHDMSAVWQLKQLDLSWNLLSTITPKAFASLTRLELLSLEGNRLYQSEILCVLHFIEEVNLAEIFFNSVSCLSNLSNAHLNDVSSNNVTDLVIGTRTQCPSECQVITLHAENNQLTSFMLTCSDKQQYTMVDLSNNDLTDFLHLFPDAKKVKCFIKIMNVSWNRPALDYLAFKDSFFPFLDTVDP